MAHRSSPLEVSVIQARSFLLRATGAAAPTSSASAAIMRLGYVQMDPIDVCGKMHDLVLRNRIEGYCRDGLLRLLYDKASREFFEHYIPQRGILVAMPVTDYRYIVRSMRSRRNREGYGGALEPTQQKLARIILHRIKEEGPLGAAAFQNTERSETGWGTQGTLAKTTLDKLFYHGRLLVSHREKFRRIFDLPERILPLEVVKARPASPREELRWLVMERLRQRRLVRLSAAQLSLVNQVVQPVRVADAGLLYCLREDAALFEESGVDMPPMLLAPLDPVVYDRVITRSVWDFDYTWEVYTPQAKRVRGYYALPLVVDGAIVGHVDPKADRSTDTLIARTNVSDESLVLPALRKLADFLGLALVRLES